MHIEKKLAEKYHYKPLPAEISLKYRDFFKSNIPEWLFVSGNNAPLFTSSGSLICNRYKRIVIGDYGAFVEFDFNDGAEGIIIQPGQEYRTSDAAYKNVKYLWMTILDGSDVKIYWQKRAVLYADYIPGMYYVSVHECFPVN